VDGISVFIGIDGRQGHGHGVANECDGEGVGNYVREHVESRHPRAGEAEGVRTVTPPQQQILQHTDEMKYEI